MPISYVYILRCFKDGKNIFYTGLSKNPARRLLEHKSGKVKSTKHFSGNVQMVYLEQLYHRDQQIVNSITWKREKQIKKYNRQKKKKLIREKQASSTALIRKLIRYGG